ncbi:hypothetical protein MUA01_01890 [Enterobacteriaceae bacterium H18W14]|uniref:hypothetical protein n=1 Tax=Dryocola boscaweniae TaxID=2925397 RepID=UPI0022F06CD9|nr:hypothetical protein [Dryocola boscaweniae]MCT4713753.1 hypothetical protein [Dryocola boscaweniae]
MKKVKRLTVLFSPWRAITENTLEADAPDTSQENNSPANIIAFNIKNYYMADICSLSEGTSHNQKRFLPSGFAQPAGAILASSGARTFPCHFSPKI